MQIRLGAALLWTVAAYRLLQTGFEVRAHPSSANILTRIGLTRPSRGSSFSCVGEPFGSGAEARAPVFAMSQFDSIGGANLQHPARPVQEPFRVDGVERRTRTWRAPLLGVSVGHPLSPTRCHERIGVSSAAPRVTPPFERRDAWLIGLTKLFVPAPPAKENAFPKTKMPFTVSSSFSAPEDHSPRPFRIRSPCHAALGSRLFREACQICSSSEWHCNKEYQRLFSAPRAPKP